MSYLVAFREALRTPPHGVSREHAYVICDPLTWCSACLLIGVGDAHGLEVPEVAPMQVLRTVATYRPTAFGFGHNHPTSPPWPSGKDLQHCAQLQHAAKAWGIRLTDYVIYSNLTGQLFSFRTAGVLDDLTKALPYHQKALEYAYRETAR